MLSATSPTVPIVQLTYSGKVNPLDVVGAHLRCKISPNWSEAADDPRVERDAIHGRKGHPHWHICGIPEVLYTDNGSDFTSKHVEQVAVDLKMRLVFSTPGKPQGRGRIERFFRTVNEMFLCELDGYIKRKRHKPSLSLERFEELFRTLLLETYHPRNSVERRPAPLE